MSAFLWVSLGGALGAAARYGISLLPLRSSFPALTLLTNLLGALLIGWVVGTLGRQGDAPAALLFWKTGVCGGFTTFSTFSLETLTLLEEGKPWQGGLYALLSVALCLLGVYLGRWVALRYAPHAL